MEDTMREIIVIQCQGRKKEEQKSWRWGSQQVIFVADKEKYAHSNGASALVPYEPDDPVSNGSTITWRQMFLEYYQTKRKPAVLQEADGLPEAWQLYKDSVYEHLVRHYGKENVFILSAGWGLVNADYRLPPYNITFSTAENTPKYARTSVEKLWQRLEPLNYNPLCKIANKDTTIYFFGSEKYRDLLYYYADPIPAIKVVFYKSKKKPEDRENYSFVNVDGQLKKLDIKLANVRYPYKCAQLFIEGKLKPHE
jgi:hypothetical protein